MADEPRCRRLQVRLVSTSGHFQCLPVVRSVQAILTDVLVACGSIRATPGNHVSSATVKSHKDRSPIQNATTAVSSDNEVQSAAVVELDQDRAAVEPDAPAENQGQAATTLEAPSGVQREESQDAVSGGARQARDGEPLQAQPYAPQNVDDRGTSTPSRRNRVPEALIMVDKSSRKKPTMSESELAAQRSSEATQAAAREALKHGYQAARRGQRISKEPSSSPMHAPSTMHYSRPHPYPYPHPHPYPYQPATGRPPPYQQYWQPHGQPTYAPPRPPPPPTPPTPPPPPTTGLECAEVKAEQARLLTFLRSLHPVLVVGQLCKALAYYGGIPSAPPPADYASFPQSDKRNGSGALIVSWLSEIFPPAGANQPAYSNTGRMTQELLIGGADDSRPAGGTDSNSVRRELPSWVERRPRGRPKGSKSSKARKDKGIKKGPKTSAGGPEPTTAVEVHVIEDNNEESSDDGQETQSSSTQPPQTTQVDRPQESSTQIQPSVAANPTTPGSRGRGRPRGSKNRPKPVTVDLTQAQSDSNASASGSQASPTMTATRHAVHGATQQRMPPSAHPAGEGALSQHAQFWTEPSPQSQRHTHPHSSNEPPDHSGKRKYPDTSLDESSMAQNSQTPRPANTGRSLHATAPQAAQPKRRRVSQAPGAVQLQAANLYSHSSGEVSGSPGLPNTVSSTATPTPPNSRSFSSQSPHGSASFPESESVQPSPYRHQQAPPQQPTLSPSAVTQRHKQPRPTQATEFYSQHGQQNQVVSQSNRRASRSFGHDHPIQQQQATSSAPTDAISGSASEHPGNDGGRLGSLNSLSATQSWTQRDGGSRQD